MCGRYSLKNSRRVKEIYNLDDVAYVRVASGYRSFKDINEFMVELKDILKNKEHDK